MKFTSEDLLKAMGLEIGSRFILNDRIFEIYLSPQNEIRCVNVNNSNQHFYFKNLVDKEIEILPPVKHIGDLSCAEYSQKYGCKKCPLRCLDCDCVIRVNVNLKLYYVLEKLCKFLNDTEVYNFFKAMLDKEVIQ